MNSWMRRVVWLGFFWLAGSLTNSAAAGLIVLSDFDDGSFQGWSRRLPFGGSLFHSATGGHPSGFVGARDTVPGGGGLYVGAPAAFTGDLSGYDQLVWDEFIYPHGSHTRGATSAVIIGGPNRTAWLYPGAGALTQVNTWVPRSVSLTDPAGWMQITNFGASGMDSFDAVVRDVESLYLGLDTANIATGNYEAGIDNVGFVTTTVVPEPSALVLLCGGCGGLLAWRSARGKKTGRAYPDRGTVGR